MAKIAFVAIVVAFGFADSARGCSMVMLPEPPRIGVGAGVFIFVGEVIGYTEPVTDPNNLRGSVTGLKLKVVENIHVSTFTGDYIELFRFGHGPDCFPEAARGDVPIGTRLRVSLTPASLVGSRSGSHVRLESTVFSRLSSGEPMFGYSTTASSVFDYKNELPKLAEEFIPFEMADKRNWFLDFLHVETSKDLLRLYKVTNEKDRMDILERLLYCPNIDYSYLLHSKIGRSKGTIEIYGRPAQFTQEKKLVFGKAKLTKRETKLFVERGRLEQAGELNVSKNWKDTPN